MTRSPRSEPARAGNRWGLVETNVTPALADWLEDWFLAEGALAVSREGATRLVDEASDAPPAWPSPLLRALYPSPEQGERAARTLGRLGLPARARAADDDELLAPSREPLPPRAFAGRLLVLGGSDPLPPRAPAAVVRLDPGAGFGTGTHPTTALCLDWLARHDLTDLLVLDYGTGSGILALAALALGARRAWGIETDPLARLAARENGRRNGAGRRFLVRASPARPPFAADLVCANLLRNILLDLAPRMPRLHRPGAHLLLSGILPAQGAEVAAAYAPRYRCVEEIVRDGWAGLVLRHEEGRP